MTVTEFDTIEYCLKNKIPSFTFKMDHSKRALVQWGNVNVSNFKNYIDKKDNGFAIKTGDTHIVIDFDLKNNPPKEIYNVLHRNCSSIEKTPGGYHFWFAVDARTAHFSSIAGAFWDNRKIDGIDIRAKGGICYVAPAHYTGVDGESKKYEWTHGNLSTAREITSELLEHIACEHSDSESVTTHDTSIVHTIATVDEINEIMNLLSQERVDNRDSWIKVGMALKHSGYSCDLWDEWSKRSDKYRGGECERQWRSFREKDKHIGIGTIYYYAKKDNYKEYIKLHSTKNQIKYGMMTGTHASVAEVFYRLNPGRFLYSSIEGWYMLQENNTWLFIESKDATDIPKIYNIVHKECEELLLNISQAFTGKDDTSSVVQFKMSRKAMSNISTKNFINGVLAFLSGHYYKEGVEKLFNEKRELFAFNNCVFDTNKMEFHPIVPEDYITVTCDYDYPHSTSREVRDEEKNMVMKFLEDVFPEKDVRDYMMSALSKTLEGYNKGEWFHVLTGLGANGKSSLMDLCAKTFGSYYKTLSVSYLTKEDEGRQKPLPEVVEARWARMLCVSEPEAKDKLQVSFLKLITGGDEINCRGIFGKNIVRFVPQFKVWIQTNDMPVLSKYDQGIERRMRCIFFNTRFVDNPRNENHRQKNIELKNDILYNESWRNGFIDLLIDYYKKSKSVKLELPNEMQTFTENYMLENNPIGSWLKKYYEITGDRSDIIQRTELYNQFKNDTCIQKNQKDFAKELLKSNINEKKLDGRHYYYGLIRKEIEQEED